MMGNRRNTAYGANGELPEPILKIQGKHRGNIGEIKGNHGEADENFRKIIGPEETTGKAMGNHRKIMGRLGEFMGH